MEVWPFWWDFLFVSFYPSPVIWSSICFLSASGLALSMCCGFSTRTEGKATGKWLGQEAVHSDDLLEAGNVQTGGGKAERIPTLWGAHGILWNTMKTAMHRYGPQLSFHFTAKQNIISFGYMSVCTRVLSPCQCELDKLSIFWIVCFHVITVRPSAFLPAL